MTQTKLKRKDVYKENIKIPTYTINSQNDGYQMQN